MADAVQARIEREARFASDVSHELRSPITALAAAAEVINGRRGELPDRTQQALDVVVGQVRRFDDMVIDLLELSRIDAGATDLHTEEVDVAMLCRRVASRNGFAELPIDVAGHPGGNGAPVTAVVDKLRFERILANLLENAAHHGGGPLRISIEPAEGSFLLARRRGRRPRRGTGRAHPHLRALRPRQRRPASHRHRARPRARRRARRRPGRRGVGRGPPRGWRPIRGADPHRDVSMNRLLLVGVAAVALAASCGVAGDGELQEINSAELFGLDETTTSTSSTMFPSATAPVDNTTGPTSSTIATEPVELYFLDGNRLVDVSIDMARSPSPSRVVAALLTGPPSGEIGIGLRTLLPEDLVNTVVESAAGYVTVDLAGEPFQQIDPADQRAAIAQLVLTLTARPGVGQVRFTLDGEPLPVPRRGGLQSAPGEPVSRLDYESMLRVIEPEPTTTTESPAPADTAPASPPPVTPPP